MAGVRLVGLAKVFVGGVVAVDDLHLEVRDREFVTLVGPSGCGKSTTLRMVAGLEKPSRGDIYFGDRRVTDLEPRDRNIAMVFQSYALYPHMTVRENLEYGLRKRRVPRPEREARVAEIAATLRIGDLLERRPKELSGGQRQRVALGRALIRRPEVFLLDEPLSNLDAKLRVYMRAELVKLHRSVATTMIYVTHDQLEAMTMSDRIVVLNRGTIQQVGTPAQVYNAPANRFVAEFIGTPAMTLLRGHLREVAGGLRFETEGVAVGLPAEAAARVRANGAGPAVLLGVRPEDVALVNPGAPGAVAAVVSVVELVGAEQIVFLTCEGHTLLARLGADERVEADQKVGLRFKPAKLHLFDATTERAIR